MLTLIQHGHVYAPDDRGLQSILLVGDTIGHIGPVDQRALAALPLVCEVIDASDCVVVPGFIDPHEHLIGAGGEDGYATRMPEVSLRQIVCAGITTVVGCLGTDMTTRHLTSLLAKAKQLEAGGITAFMYTGGYAIPPRTLAQTITDDLVMIPNVIGLGELAISDTRCSEPTLNELARMVSQAITGGMIGGKAGVTHFHVGPGKKRLSLLRQMIEEHETPPQFLYPTHINRSTELMDEAIAFARLGAFVDIDTVDDDLPRWLQYYREHGGDLGQLTVSSDAHTAEGSPQKLYRSFLRVIAELNLSLAEVLPLFTTNAATVLQLTQKGHLEQGKDADILILREHTLEVVHVIAHGRVLVRDGQFVVKGVHDETPALV
jgi:beta-aspartyl-dipeptidase (metallo-type)